MAATPSAQPRLWQGGHRLEAATVRSGIVLTAERPSTTPGAMSGLQACRPTDEATKVPSQAPRGGGSSSSEASRSRSSLEGKIHWAELGGDGDEWRRGR
jgi:hypothetical protein